MLRWEMTIKVPRANENETFDDFVIYRNFLVPHSFIPVTVMKIESMYCLKVVATWKRYAKCKTRNTTHSKNIHFWVSLNAHWSLIKFSCLMFFWTVWKIFMGLILTGLVVYVVFMAQINFTPTEWCEELAVLQKSNDVLLSSISIDTRIISVIVLSALYCITNHSWLIEFLICPRIWLNVPLKCSGLI